MKPKLAHKREPSYYISSDAGTTENGPFLLEELRAMARENTITPDVWFRQEDEEDLRPLSDEPALLADLWPEDDYFDPTADAAPEPPPSDPKEEHRGFDTSAVLQENVERDRSARQASGIPEDRPSALAEFWALRGALVRWILGLAFIGGGVALWVIGAGGVVTFFFGVILLLAGLVFIAFDLAQIVAAPFTGFFGALLEGTGGGGRADYWTADALKQQGDHRLALAEYRKIALQYPRETKAYIEGIRCARTIGDKREEERLHAMAMKNLKSDQDRNLFANAVQRLDKQS